MPPRILVVDDDHSILKLISDVLSREGYQVTGCARAESALESAGKLSPDAAVLDIRLVGMDGYTLSRALRSMPGLNSLPCVFISGDAGAAELAESVSHHSLRVIRKGPLINLVVADEVRLALAARDGEALDGAECTPPEPAVAGAAFVSLGTHEIIYDGWRRRIPRHPFEALRALLARGGEIACEELRRRIWKRPSDDHELQVVISRLRGDLGPAGADWILKTLSGYKLATQPIPARGGFWLPKP